MLKLISKMIANNSAANIIFFSDTGFRIHGTLPKTIPAIIHAARNLLSSVKEQTKDAVAIDAATTMKRTALTCSSVILMPIALKFK